MSSGMRAALATLVFVVAATSPARSETLRATYDISLLGLPIGSGTVNAEVSANSYADRRAGEAERAREPRRKFARRFAWSRRDRRRSGVARDLRHHGGELEDDPHHSHGDEEQLCRGGRHRSAVRGQARSRARAARRQAQRDRPRRRLRIAGAERRAARFAGRLRPHAVDLRRLDAFRPEAELDGRTQGRRQGLQRTRSPSARCATCRSPAIARIGRRRNSCRRTRIWRSGSRRSAPPACSMPFRISVKTMVGTVVIEASEFEVTK